MNRAKHRCFYWASMFCVFLLVFVSSRLPSPSAPRVGGV
jgi:hypothetical protein